MRPLFLITALWCLASATMAANGKALPPDAKERAAVVGELSHRSGLPTAELSRLLADCDANQQSLYFCAWRDQISAERAFRNTLNKQVQKAPQCERALQANLADWARSRDRTCEKSATKEWGDGSMKPTAQAQCVTAETLSMTKRLAHMRGCRLR